MFQSYRTQVGFSSRELNLQITLWKKGTPLLGQFLKMTLLQLIKKNDILEIEGVSFSV